MSDRAPLLALQHVSFATSDGTCDLLHDISFQIFAGNVTALIGPSGAGKSSLLRLLNRLRNPSAGKIFYKHQELRQIPILQLRRQIVLVPQEPKLLGMNVAQAIAYPLHLQQLPKPEIKRRVATCCEQLQIPAEWRDRGEFQLSLGQRQRVAIARALVLQPQVLLLDEPTSALDLGTASGLLQALTGLVNGGQTTLVMVNHSLELAQQFCDRVLYLRDGQLVRDTVAHELDWSEIRQDLMHLMHTAPSMVEEWE